MKNPLERCYKSLRGSIALVVAECLVFAAVACVGGPKIVHAHAGLDHAALGAIADHASQYRAEAQQIVASVTQGEGNMADESDTSCEEVKSRFEGRIHESSLVAVTHVSKLDAIYAAAQQYYVKQGLQIDGYDKLSESVGSAQTSATVDTGVMAVLNRPITCSSKMPLNDVIAFRKASLVASDSIGQYRDLLTELLMLIRNDVVNTIKSSS